MPSKYGNKSHATPAHLKGFLTYGVSIDTRPLLSLRPTLRAFGGLRHHRAVQTSIHVIRMIHVTHVITHELG